MTELEQKILGALVDLDTSVKTMPTAQLKPNLLALFARIDQLGNLLPETADPNLRHYLRKKSYDKARLFLEGREAENAAGNCRTHVG